MPNVLVLYHCRSIQHFASFRNRTSWRSHRPHCFILADRQSYYLPSNSTQMVIFLHIIDWLSLLVACLSINIISFIFGRKEAWGYSRTGQPGMLKIMDKNDKEWTHSLFFVERTSFGLALLCISYLASKSFINAILLLAYFPMTFSFFHTVGYNTTMIKLGVKGYEDPLQDWSHTDAKFDQPNKLEAISTIIAFVGIILCKIWLI